MAGRGRNLEVVERLMCDELYTNLGDEPDIELTWMLLRKLIGRQLLASEYVTVPFLDSAIYYNQMFVFKKQKSTLSCLGIGTPTYKIVGNLDYLVDRHISTWSPHCDFSSWDITDGLSMYRGYRLSVSSNPDFGEAKSIELVVMGLYVRSAQPPMPGKLKIHMNMLEDLDGVRTLYVISEVVYASYLRLSVGVGTRNRTAIYDFDYPIGFKYRKYRVTADGQFVQELLTTIRLSNMGATWLRPLPQPVPFWDPSRKRYCNPVSVRKTKSNLTIRSPDDRHRRRPWAQEVASRDNRARANGAVVHAAVPAVPDDQDNPDEEWPRNVLRARIRRRAISADNLTY